MGNQLEKLVGDLPGFAYCSIVPPQIIPSKVRIPIIAKAYGSLEAMIIGAKDIHKYLTNKDYAIGKVMVKEGTKTQRMSGSFGTLSAVEFALEILEEKEYNSMAITYERGGIFSRSRSNVYLNKESKINRISIPSNILVSEKPLDGWK